MCVKLCGCWEVPSLMPVLNLHLGLFPQIIRQVFHRYFPSRYIGSISKDSEREVAIEAARLYELMGRIYFYSNETLPIMYCILRFMNTAEKAGPSPELASAYAGMAVLAGFAQLHPLAETYVERALAVAKEVNQPSNLITVSVVTSVYKITVGKWDEVRARVEEAKAICEQLGDYRQWGDCTVLLAENALISGDIQYAMNIQKILLEDARRSDATPCSRAGDCSGSRRTTSGWGTKRWQSPCLKKLFKSWRSFPILPLRSIRTDSLPWLIYDWVRMDRRWLTRAWFLIWQRIFRQRSIPWISDLPPRQMFILNYGKKRFRTQAGKLMPININCLPKKRSSSCAPSKRFSRSAACHALLSGLV